MEANLIKSVVPTASHRPSWSADCFLQGSVRGLCMCTVGRYEGVVLGEAAAASELWDFREEDCVWGPWVAPDFIYEGVLIS